MANAPAVSVVIATYNRAHLIAETLESILGQRFQDFEIIVVDDGSTDNTREVVSRYAGRVRYIHQNNRGPSAARNSGVRQARGSWISFQDSDDLSAPNHLAVLHGYAETHRNCAMVFANGAYLKGPEHKRSTIIPDGKSRSFARRGVGLADIFDKSIVRLQAALIARPAYEELGGHDESLRICMDLDLSFRLLMSFPIAYLDEVVFFYRRHEGNTGRNEELRLSENIRVIEKLLRDHAKSAELLGRRHVAARLAYRYYRLAKSRWQRREADNARVALLQALALCPINLKYRFYQLLWGVQPRRARQA
jgi:glycosyltransferase involved in cell wall biosynthesis